jgi:hypothetical protein
MQEACDPGYVIVGEQEGGILVQKSGGDENVELLVAIQLQDAADAVQDLAAHATLTRFKPTERTSSDRRQVGDLFLGQTALVSEPGEQAT